MTKTEKIEAILGIKGFNPADFDSIHGGGYYPTIMGEVYLKEKPNIYQAVNTRVWVFERTTDEQGEPFVDGEEIRIYT